MAASDTPDELCVDAGSEECSEGPSAVAAGRGLRAVTYRGEAYVIVGIYLARGHNGHRELRYLLEPMRRTPKAHGN